LGRKRKYQEKYADKKKNPFNKFYVHEIDILKIWTDKI
jgi:hypothetical protein